MRVRSATAGDLPAVERLLAENKLPLDGVSDHFDDFLVADDGTRIAGAVGLESYGRFALLRSAVVSADRHNEGVGTLLVERILDRAREQGVREIYLLTTTAEKYFPRFGFAETERNAVPDPIRASAEFRGACPDSAVVMKRRIT